MAKQLKRIIKKTLVEEKEKPKLLASEFDWRLAPEWWDLEVEDVPLPPKEDVEKILNIKRKEVAGL